MIEAWGEPPGAIAVKDGTIVLPLASACDCLLGVQPARGIHGEDERAYHARDIPPDHQCLAFYFYIEKVFKADALLHFGTHGTLEFMPGKEVALSADCFSDNLIGSMLNIYYYWIGNTAEASIAKRRSYALCVSHASPPVVNAGLYEEYAAHEQSIADYAENPTRNRSMKLCARQRSLDCRKRSVV